MHQPSDNPMLGRPPRGPFMNLRDIAFWIGSARADAVLERHRDSADQINKFDHLYGAQNDPFGAEKSGYLYQRRKYADLLSMLPKRTYRHALDIGCGIGAFTRRLAPHVDHVLGVDISGEAIRQAREMSCAFPQISYEQRNIANIGDLSGLFDLIVLADVLYYVARKRLAAGKLTERGTSIVLNCPVVSTP